MNLKQSTLVQLNALVNKSERGGYHVIPGVKLEINLSYQEMVDVCHELYEQGLKYGTDGVLYDVDITQKNPRILINTQDKLNALDDALKYGVKYYEISFRGYSLVVK